jgi:hypothetical protein
MWPCIKHQKIYVTGSHLISFFLRIPFAKRERAKLKMLFDKNSPVKLKS